MKISKDKKLFIASAASSLAILGLPPKDISLLKAILYPRAIEGLYSLLKERGLIKPLPYGGETVLALLTNFVIVYNYTYENFNLPGNMIKTINIYCDWTMGEQGMVGFNRLKNKNMLIQVYGSERIEELSKLN